MHTTEWKYAGTIAGLWPTLILILLGSLALPPLHTSTGEGDDYVGRRGLSAGSYSGWPKGGSRHS